MYNKLIFQGIKGRNVLRGSFSPPVCVDTAMSSQTNNTTIENLQRAYKAVLLQIVRNLEKYEQEELRFFFDELISRRKPGALSIMSSLENAGKISWSDVSFLKEGLEEVKRLDLVGLERLEHSISNTEIHNGIQVFPIELSNQTVSISIIAREG